MRFETAARMTEPSRVLHDLLEQHETLRGMIEACEQLAEDVDRGSNDPGRLVREVTRLRLAFEAHNRHEESVLPRLLHEVDAFGEVRVARMVSDHGDEHRSLRRRLDGPTHELRATMDQLRAHLAAEERVFLSPRVLRDDVVTLEGAG
jgi:hypothetical protein